MVFTNGNDLYYLDLVPQRTVLLAPAPRTQCTLGPVSTRAHRGGIID